MIERKTNGRMREREREKQKEE